VSDARNGNPILTIRNGTPVSAVAFDRQGRYVVTGDSEGAVRLWRVAPDALAKYLAEASTACLSPADRQRFLSEDETTAHADYQACERRFGRVVP
jgi:WD40 repeat protein